MLFRSSSKSKNVIDEHKQLEQLLRHLGMIAQCTDEGIAVVDLKGTIHFVNTAWAKMHKYETSNELLGKQISEFFATEQIKTDVIPLMEEARRKGRSRGAIEHARKDGTRFATQMKVTVLKDEAGRAGGLMVIITDISERKKLEEEAAVGTTEERTKLQEQIEQLQRQIGEHEQAEEHLRQQAGELTAANEQLKHQITERKKLEEAAAVETTEEGKKLKEQIEQLQRQIGEREQAEERLRQEAGEITAANEELTRQIGEREKARKELMRQLDALTDAIEEIRFETTDNARESGEPVKPFDVEKLKSIADLAKRLK